MKLGSKMVKLESKKVKLGNSLVMLENKTAKLESRRVMWASRTEMWGCSLGWWENKMVTLASMMERLESSQGSEGCIHQENEAHRQERLESNWETRLLKIKEKKCA